MSWVFSHTIERTKTNQTHDRSCPRARRALDSAWRRHRWWWEWQRWAQWRARQLRPASSTLDATILRAWWSGTLREKHPRNCQIQRDPNFSCSPTLHFSSRLHCWIASYQMNRNSSHSTDQYCPPCSMHEDSDAHVREAVTKKKQFNNNISEVFSHIIRRKNDRQGNETQIIIIKSCIQTEKFSVIQQ